MQWDREGKTDDTGGIYGQVTSLGTWGALGSCVDRPQSCAIQEMRQVECLSTVVGWLRSVPKAERTCGQSPQAERDTRVWDQNLQQGDW